MPNKIKGFTLIELLVVIAIIGILAGLVIVSMSGGETSAHDARVKSDLDQIRATAEIIRIQDGNYVNVNGSSINGDITSLLTDCNSHDNTSANTCITFANAANWCGKAQLQGTGNWCVDSTGYAGNNDTWCVSGNVACH